MIGRRRESSKLYKRAAETALRRGLADVAAAFEEADARADGLSGNCGTARHLGRPALALALCGDVTGAGKLATETSTVFLMGPFGMRCNSLRFGQRLSSSGVSLIRRWNCWHPLRLTSAPIPKWYICEV